MSQNTRTNKTDSIVDETIAEALLIAEFFALAHQGQGTTPPHDLDEEQFEIAREYLILPIGIEIFGSPIADGSHRG